MKKTRKQHYVPQFYLRQWIDQSEGFYPMKVVTKTPPELLVFNEKSNPSRFCYENFFYAQYTGKEDDISQVIEGGFAEIEGVFSKELPRLEAKIVNNEQITDEDKFGLATFMIFTWIRGKKHREHSQQMTDHMMKEINKRLVHFMDKNPKTKADMERYGLTKEDMIEFAEKGEYRVEMGNMHHMALLKDMEGFTNMLWAKYWKVYISRKGEFIATDAPYLDKALSREFLGNDFLSREQSFILSPRVMIVARYPKNEKGKKFSREDITNDKGKIHTINTHNLMRSIRFGFHKDKNILEEVKKTAVFLHNLKQSEK